MIRTGARQGFVMVVVLGVMAVLVVLVGALQHQGLSARQAAVVMEAKYLADRSADSIRGTLESSLEQNLPTGTEQHYFANDSSTSITLGPDPTQNIDRNSVYIDADNYYRGGKEYAAHIFDSPNKLAIGNLREVKLEESLRGRDRLIFPQTLRTEGQPTSWNPTYDLFKRNRYQSVYVAGFPYAAFAPGENQSVELEKLGTWTLPAWEQNGDDFHPLEQSSGLAPYVGAGGDISVTQVRYGKAFSRAGTIDCQGEVIGFKGFLPHQTWGKRSYFELMETSLSDVAANLSNISTDKTGAIFGRLTLKETMNLVIKGSAPSNYLTYQSASNWWFFLLPQVKTLGSGVQISLHVPLPADLGVVTDTAGSSLGLTQISELRKANEKLEQELLPDSAPDDEAEWDGTTEGLIPQLSWLGKQYQKLEAEVDRLRAVDPDDSTIERKEAQMSAVRDEIESLELTIQRKQENIEDNKEEISQLSDDLKDQMNSWVEGDPKGPNQLVEFVMKHTKVGEPMDTGAHMGKPPGKKSEAGGVKDDKTALLSSRGMLYHSYVTVMLRLANELRQVIERAVSSFPMKKTKIKLPGKTIRIKVPNFKKFPGWFKGIGNKMVEGLQTLAVYEVPLTFMDGVPLKKIGPSHFKIQDTFQVPRGRTFSLTGDMTVQGDLWLQKGSSMTVSGNLTMVRPLNNGIAVFGEVMQPHGRIYMEEGTSLVVGGDLKGAGDKYLGSVVVCAPVGVNHGISSVIICDGSASLPFGTASGIDAVDLAAWASGEGAGETFRQFMEDWIPNLSKLPTWMGAFEGRTPYFGRFPVIFMVFPPNPAPVPTFQTTGKNYNVQLFRTLSLFMAIQLNLTLGENFSTTTLWWAWGGEQVAVFPKSAAVGAKDEIAAGIDTAAREFKTITKLDLDDIVDQALEEGIEVISDPRTTTELMVKIVAQAFNPDPTGASDRLVEDALTNVTGVKKTSEKAANDCNMLMKSPGGRDFSVFSGMRKELRKLEDAVNVLELSTGLSTTSDSVRTSAQVLLVESPGVLVYAKNSLTVGPEEWYDSPCVRAVGCFISRGNVQMNVRYTIGSLLSGEGSIQARELYYTPAYTRASVYIPKQLELGGQRIGANDDYWKNARNMKYGSALDTQKAMDIPASQVFFQASEGWGP